LLKYNNLQHANCISSSALANSLPTAKYTYPTPLKQKKRETAVPLSVLEAGIEAPQLKLQARADALKRRPSVEQSIFSYPRNRLLSEYPACCWNCFRGQKAKPVL
jgi:hypothetical protein